MFEGSERTVSYTCGDGHEAKRTSRFPTSLTWRITTPLNCDESFSIWPSTQLTAKGITILREDNFAHFFGKFSIVKKNAGNPDVPYFKGIIELICRSGSHQILGEKCDEENHIEGWDYWTGTATGVQIYAASCDRSQGATYPRRRSVCGHDSQQNHWHADQESLAEINRRSSQCDYEALCIVMA